MSETSKEYEKAIHYLYELIQNGELKIGSKLPTERSIAEQLNISRNSTREALRVLENTGLIESRHGSGNYLTGNMSKTISSVTNMMLLLQQTTKEEICFFRRNMEKSVCLSILEKGSIARWYEPLSDVLAKAEALISSDSPISSNLSASPDSHTSPSSGNLSASPDSPALSSSGNLPELDFQFHYLLIQATENQFFISLSDAITTIYRNWINNAIQNTDKSVKMEFHQTHLAMLNALKAGDRIQCEKAIDAHYDLADQKMQVQ